MGIMMGGVFVSEGSMSILGERIRALRDLKGWSLRELSRRSGLSHAMIGHIETGERDGTIETICQLAEALGVSPGLLQEPGISLDRIERISQMLDRIDQLDDDGIEAVDRMLDALPKR